MNLQGVDDFIRRLLMIAVLGIILAEWSLSPCVTNIS